MECMNCECCKGNVYECEGETCVQLGSCYCLVKIEIERDSKINQDQILQELEQQIWDEQRNQQEFD
jgi:hypothetical protein